MDLLQSYLSSEESDAESGAVNRHNDDGTGDISDSASETPALHMMMHAPRAQQAICQMTFLETNLVTRALL